MGYDWDKGGTIIVEFVNQWLVQPESHATRVSPPLILECEDPEAVWLRDLR